MSNDHAATAAPLPATASAGVNARSSDRGVGETLHVPPVAPRVALRIRQIGPAPPRLSSPIQMHVAAPAESTPTAARLAAFPSWETKTGLLHAGSANAHDPGSVTSAASARALCPS